MTNPTTPFSWQMPTASDLVTDLPADFETFGQAVATSMADLLGGTTGQILAKASNTDMDFTWVANDVGDITAVTAGTGLSGGGTSGAVTITNDMATTITAAGDIVVGTGSGTYDNLPIGTTNQVLTADTTVSPYKVKWATPAGGGGGKVLQVINVIYTTETSTASSTFADTGLTATITPTSATSKIMAFVTIPAYKDSSNTSAAFKLLRASTTIATLSNAVYDASTTGNDVGACAINYLDSPATTSATIYKVQFASESNTSRVIINRAGNQANSSSITLMEIGA